MRSTYNTEIKLSFLQADKVQSIITRVINGPVGKLYRIQLQYGHCLFTRDFSSFDSYLKNHQVLLKAADQNKPVPNIFISADN